MDYRKEIDGLRALAIIPVVLFHAKIPIFSGGYIGVDVFYVVSGYLITSIILLEYGNKSFNILNFWERRARRILPALIFVSIFCMLSAWVLFAPQDLKDFSKSLIAACFSVSNILFWKTRDYFDTFSDFNPLLHTWSLGVEEQFYLIFPIIFSVLIRFGARALFFGIFFSAVSSLVLAQEFVRSHPGATFYLLPFRAWELLIGACAAIYANSAEGYSKNNIGREILGILGLIFIVVPVFCFDESTPTPSWYTLFPTLGAALVLTYADRQTGVGRFLSNRLLVFIGLSSYSLYLWHQPIFAFARHLGVANTEISVYLTLSVMALAFSYATSNYIERPFRNKNKMKGPMFALLIIPSFLIILTFGVFGVVTNGFLKYKATPEQASVMRSAVASPMRKKCHASVNNFIEPKKACEYISGELGVAIFGDSHAVELAYALSEDLRPTGVKLKHFSFSGCVPYWGAVLESDEKNCATWTKQVVNYINKNNGIKTVVISYRINAALFGGHEKTYPALPSEFSESQRLNRWNAYLAIIKEFLVNGKQVVLVLQVPELPKRIQDLIVESKNPSDLIYGVSTDWWKRRNEFVMSRIGEIPPDVIVIDPTDVFCDKVHCYAGSKGLAYYFDDDHLSVVGARLVSNEIIKKLKSHNLR